MDVAQDRNALYYPYIHIRDVNWLKATLLCFSQVRRIVPPDFHLNDLDEIRPFREIRGARGEPLLVEEFTDMQGGDSPVYRAQQRLLRTLNEHEEFVQRRYSRQAAIREFPEDPNAFQMHTGKMLRELADYLTSKKLAWLPKTIPNTWVDSRWLALHPDLGEAVLSVVAIAIARAKGLDIVTNSGRVHHAIAALDEDEVLDQLLQRGEGRQQATAAELTDELAEILLTTRFDVSQLTVQQIAELIKDGKDLRAFKSALVPIAQSLPDIADPEERERRLREKAQEVMEEWGKYRKSLPRFAIDALVDATELKMPDIATALLAGATGVALVSGWGLAIGLLTWKAVGVYRKFKERESDPLRFLSSVQRAGATLVIPSGGSRPSSPQ
jgi:hypothetical protein